MAPLDAELPRPRRERDVVRLDGQVPDRAALEHLDAVLRPADSELIVLLRGHVAGDARLLRRQIERHGQTEHHLLLPDPEESRRFDGTVEAVPTAPQTVGRLGEVVAVALRRLHPAPLHARPRVHKGHRLGETLRHGVGDAVGLDEEPRRAVVTGGEPAVLTESHRCQVDLTSRDVVHHPLVELAEPQMDHPPISSRIVHQIGMAAALEQVAAQVAIGQHRVPRIALEWAIDVRPAGINDHVAVLRASLGRHQVIIAADLVEMRALEEPPARALPDAASGGELLARLDVDLALDDAMLPGIIRAVGHEIDLVALKIEGGVDAVLLDVDRVRPFAVDVVCPNVEIAAMGDIGRDHVEPPIPITDGRRIDAAGRIRLHERELALAREDVADLRPIDQVMALEERHAGEELERAGHEIIGVADTAAAGIREKARDHGVSVLHRVPPVLFLLPL